MFLGSGGWKGSQFGLHLISIKDTFLYPMCTHDAIEI